MTVLVPPPTGSRFLTSGPAARASASGPSPYRTLLVGGEPFAHDQTLVSAYAEALARLTGHGIDVSAVPAGPLADAVDGRLLSDHDLSRIDAVVVLLDPSSSPRAESRTTDAVRLLLSSIGARLVAGSALVLVVPSPLSAGLAPRRLDEIESVVRESVDSLTLVVRLADGGADATGDLRSASWATAIADATASALIDPMVGFLPDDQYDEDLRLDAVDLLPPRDGLWVAQFQRIVDDARSAYGTRSAALSIIDADHARYGVTVGFRNSAVNRGQTICNRVLRTYGGLIVGDARADPRFQRNPDVRSGDVRFYAGYRIESASGAPLGSLCVFDPAPRDVDVADLVSLRDLAVAAQRHLWAFQNGTIAT